MTIKLRKTTKSKNINSCFLFFIFGRYPVNTQTIKTTAKAGVKTFASSAPKKFPCTNRNIPSVIPLNTPFTPNNRSSGEGDRPNFAIITTTGFRSKDKKTATAIRMLTRKNNL